MKQCYKCGVKNSDNCSFCGNCGTSLNEQQHNVNYQPQYQQQENTYYQPPQQPYPQQPMQVKEKKGHGCLIAMLVIVGILVLFSLAVIFLPSEDTETPETANNETNSTITENHNLEDFSIEETTIYNDNGIIIKATANQSTSTKVIIDFYIENNSDLSLNICVHSSAINGIMFNNNIYEGSIDVAAGKKANTSYSVRISDLEEMNIQEIQYFEFLFWAYDNAKSFKSFETDILKVVTDHFMEETIQFAGDEIYNTQGILIKKLYSDENSITFVVNNTNNYYIEYDVEDVSINDWSLDTTYKLDYHSNELFPHCSSIFTIKADSDFLRNNPIDEINSTEFKLEIRPEGSFSDEYITSAIDVKIN